MASLSVRELFRQARSCVVDEEGQAYGDLDVQIADAITCLFEFMAESEVERRVGVKLYERGAERKNQRNGYRSRSVQTCFTTLTIRIPRVRQGGFIPSYLEANRRAVSTTEKWVAKAFLSGVSRAEIIRLMESATGCRPSEGLLKRVQEDLDERARVFRERPLTKRYQYLFLDAAWVKDIVGVSARRICILCAMGITEDGEKEILGFERAQQESQQSWGRFLESLIRRGLDPCALQIVISDEHGGILAAVEDKLGDMAHQLCWAHRCRNIFEQVKKTDRKAMVESLRLIYRADHLTSAKAAFRSFKTRWAGEYPNVVANTEEDLGHLLAFYSAPDLHREYLRTSNPIERCFVELRRSRFGCGAFANRQSCDRVAANVFMRINQFASGKSIWTERAQRLKRKRAKEQAESSSKTTAGTVPKNRPAERQDEPTGPVAGARGAPQQSPILPDGCDVDSPCQWLCPAVV
jgi:transposase-like protein